MDARNMSEFYNGQFDCVIDKATLDSVYVKYNNKSVLIMHKKIVTKWFQKFIEF